MKFHWWKTWLIFWSKMHLLLLRFLFFGWETSIYFCPLFALLGTPLEALTNSAVKDFIFEGICMPTIYISQIPIQSPGHNFPTLHLEGVYVSKRESLGLPTWGSAAARSAAGQLHSPSSSLSPRHSSSSPLQQTPASTSAGAGAESGGQVSPAFSSPPPVCQPSSCENFSRCWNNPTWHVATVAGWCGCNNRLYHDGCSLMPLVWASIVSTWVDSTRFLQVHMWCHPKDDKSINRSLLQKITFTKIVIKAKFILFWEPCFSIYHVSFAQSKRSLFHAFQYLSAQKKINFWTSTYWDLLEAVLFHKSPKRPKV